MRRGTGLALGIVAVTGGAALAYAAGVERVRYTLRRIDVPVLAPDAEPLRVLHISDLHLTPGQVGKQNWVRELAAVDPDLVLVTGDNLAHPDAVPAVANALEPLLDRPGAFVLGSNDYTGPAPVNPFAYFRSGHKRSGGVELPWRDLASVFSSAGWADLDNAKVELKAGGRMIALAGVDCPHSGRDDYASIAGAAPEAADARIGVLHSPEPRLLDRFDADGYDLMVAGHTHGGQVCVPFHGALVTNCALPASMAKGLHRWGAASWLHVSAGLGTSPWAPVRFACPPEATVLTLVPR
jgi:predicted MPP superfamily phosphohydrolase